MVHSCAGYNCTTRFSKNSGVPFHSFPRDPELRKQWILATKRKKFVVNAGTKLCGRHFRDEDYVETTTIKRLKKGAIPSIFDFPKHLLKPEIIPRTKRYKSVEKSGLPLSPQPSSCELKESTNNVETYCVETVTPGTSKPTTETRKKKRYTYPGDFTMADMKNPKKAMLMFKICQKQLQKRAATVRKLQKKNLRLLKKITNIKELLEHLRQSNKISTSCFSLLKDSLPTAQSQLLLRQLKSNTQKQFPPELRTFALTLHFYSNAAYEYVRKEFQNCLPHPTTLRKWYSSVDGSPGVTAESFRALKIKNEECRSKGKELICALILDEMNIREQVDKIGDRYTGYVNFGTGLSSDNLPLAKEVLVFLLVALNERWKIPIAYYLIRGIRSEEKASLVKNCLSVTSDIGIKVVSVTFDGAATNFSMARILGANLEADDLKPWFLHPSANYRVYILLDPCHMVKLIRNTLGDWYFLYDKDGNIISWAFFTELVDIQEKLGLHAATKIRKRHIHYKTEKMKVKLAVQLFSKSVADALDYLRDDVHLPQFKDSKATSNFCRIIDQTFDILNTRNFLSKNPFKQPLSMRNQDSLFSYFTQVEDYIKNIKNDQGTFVLETNRKTGFLGLLICMKSIEGIFKDLVSSAMGFEYLLTYKLSQDHIEMFFCAIRARGGFNNNPSAAHFENAYKRLLVHAEIKGSYSANCLAQDATSILNITSRNKNNNVLDSLFIAQDDNNYNRDVDEECDFIFDSNFSYFNKYINDVVIYNAGFVCRRVMKNISCDVCCKVFTINQSTSDLLNRKNVGGLVKPSNDIIVLCKAAEKVFRNVENTTTIPNLEKLILQTIRHVNFENIFNSIKNHILDQDPMNNHSTQLIYSVLNTYFNIRIHHKNKSINEFKQRIRQKYSKLITFKGQ